MIGPLNYFCPNIIFYFSKISGKEAFDVINREKLVIWMNKLRQNDGSFVMHEGGEVDIRGVYCALSAAHLSNIYR